MAKPIVLITNTVPEDVLEPLRGIAKVRMGPSGGPLMPREQVLEQLPELAGIVNQAELRVDDEVVSLGKKLRIVSNVAAGFDNLNPGLLEGHGIWATNTPGVFDLPVAEYAIASILVVLRRLVAADRFVRSGQWKAVQPGPWDGRLANGKTLGIVGFGGIGRAVARIAEGLGMRVVFYNRSDRGDPRQVDLRSLTAESDVVTVHVPHTPETERMIDRSFFAGMKPGSVFANSARGKVVDEEALIEALEAGHISGAALDVFPEEPRVNPRLTAMENVLLSPHLGGATIESRRESRLLAVRNVAEVLKGNRPLTPVNEVR
jgi:glyoxylate reductase